MEISIKNNPIKITIRWFLVMGISRKRIKRYKIHRPIKRRKKQRRARERKRRNRPNRHKRIFP